MEVRRGEAAAWAGERGCGEVNDESRGPRLLPVVSGNESTDGDGDVDGNHVDMAPTLKTHQQ